MTQFKPGDVVTYENFGTLFRAKIIEIRPSGVVFIRGLDGPRAGRMTWKHKERLTKEGA